MWKLAWLLHKQDLIRPFSSGWKEECFFFVVTESLRNLSTFPLENHADFIHVNDQIYKIFVVC